MKFRTVFPMLVPALFALGLSARADEKGTSANAQRFEALKTLAGDWVAIGKDGKPTDNPLLDPRHRGWKHSPGNAVPRQRS